MAQCVARVKKISEEKNDVRAARRTLEVRRTITPRGVRILIFSVDWFKLARRPFALKKKDRSCSTLMADYYCQKKLRLLVSGEKFSFYENQLFLFWHSRSSKGL